MVMSKETYQEIVSRYSSLLLTEDDAVDALDFAHDILNAEAYMEWDAGNWRNSEYIKPEMKAACEANIKAISEMAELMTHEQLEDFVHGYSDPVKPF